MNVTRNQIWQTRGYGEQRWVVITSVESDTGRVWHRPAHRWWVEPSWLALGRFIETYKLWADVKPQPGDGERGPLPWIDPEDPRRNHRYDYQLWSHVRSQLMGPIWKNNGVDYDKAPSDILNQIRDKVTECRDAFHHLWSMGGDRERYGNLEGTLQTLVTLMYHDVERQRGIEERWGNQS